MRLRIFFATCTLLFFTLACSFVSDLISPEQEYYEEEPAPTELIPEESSTDAKGHTCSPVLYDEIMDAALKPGGDTDAQENQYLVVYTVDGDQISDPAFESVSSDLQDEQEDNTSHELVWNYFASMIPAEERTFITEYAINTDGADNTLAAVTQTQSDPALWVLEVDILDINDTGSLTFTLVHEFGHLLTLHAEQVPPSIEVFNNPEDEDILESEKSACANYFPGEGCSTADSYINAFYDRFWVDIYDEWSAIGYEEEGDAYYEQLDAFYYKYEDQFLTDYAVTTPEEDIAESFAFFVLTPQPTNDSIANQKILFFYEYPELVSLREHIRQNICTSYPEK
jgi:hypothetical protein